MRFRKSCQGAKVFWWHRKSRDFHEKLTFLENASEASRKLLGCVGSGRECFRVYRKLFWVAWRWKENGKNFDIFPCLMTLFSIGQLFDGSRSRVRVPVQHACNRAGCVDRDGEGSTGPTRGEHRLTIYRAHASCLYGKKMWHKKIEIFMKSWLFSKTLTTLSGSF